VIFDIGFLRNVLDRIEMGWFHFRPLSILRHRTLSVLIGMTDFFQRLPSAYRWRCGWQYGLADWLLAPADRYQEAASLRVACTVAAIKWEQRLW
jgi:hypothetical protein